jgi:hypothetical protein
MFRDVVPSLRCLRKLSCAVEKTTENPDYALQLYVQKLKSKANQGTIMVPLDGAVNDNKNTTLRTTNQKVHLKVWRSDHGFILSVAESACRPEPGSISSF